MSAHFRSLFPGLLPAPVSSSSCQYQLQSITPHVSRARPSRARDVRRRVAVLSAAFGVRVRIKAQPHALRRCGAAGVYLLVQRRRQAQHRPFLLGMASGCFALGVARWFV